jgi:hypothetical protein
MRLWKPNDKTEFIRLYKNALPKDFCEHLIERFEGDDRKGPGRVADGVFPEIKRSTDLNITFVDGWEEENKTLFSNIEGYITKYTKEFFPRCQVNVIDAQDWGYQIQRTDHRGHYVWHNDAAIHDGRNRLLTFIWYLNTVAKGGETEFLDRKIKPTQGNLLIFPSTWTFAHRGLPPKSGLKYICTGWLYTRFYEPPA